MMSNDTDARLVDRDYHLTRADTARAMAEEHPDRAAATHPSSPKQVRE